MASSSAMRAGPLARPLCLSGRAAVRARSAARRSALPTGSSARPSRGRAGILGTPRCLAVARALPPARASGDGTGRGLTPPRSLSTLPPTFRRPPARGRGTRGRERGIEVDAPSLEVRLLGGFRVAVGGTPVPAGAWQRRAGAAALVALLALEPGHRLHREQAVEALWPEADPAAAARDLRVALHHARAQLETAGAPPGSFLAREGEVLALGPPELVRVDVDAFAAAAARAWRAADPAVAEAAADLYGGDLLPDDPYADWTEGRRASLRGSYLTLLARLAELLEGRGELGRAIAARRTRARRRAAGRVRPRRPDPPPRPSRAAAAGAGAVRPAGRAARARRRGGAGAGDPRSWPQAIRDGRFPGAPQPLGPPAADRAAPGPGVPAGSEKPTPRVPTGTITFLFTDIEGSTARWERAPEAMAAALARHEALLRAAIEAHGGRVFKTVGDDVCAVFPVAADALAAALAAQRALAGGGPGRSRPAPGADGAAHRGGRGAGRRLPRPAGQPGRPPPGRGPRRPGPAVARDPAARARRPARGGRRCATWASTG